MKDKAKERYKVKNKALKQYCENNEAKYASVGNPTLISLEDCDIVAERAVTQYRDACIEEINTEPHKPLMAKRRAIKILNSQYKKLNK